MQPPLARALAEHLAPGGWLLLQSDVRDVAEAMRATVRDAAAGLLVAARAAAADWRAPQPAALGALATVRERSVLAGKGKTGDARVYRAVFHKL